MQPIKGSHFELKGKLKVKLVREFARARLCLRFYEAYFLGLLVPIYCLNCYICLEFVSFNKSEWDGWGVVSQPSLGFL